jgi:hypothetical protein
MISFRIGRILRKRKAFFHSQLPLLSFHVTSGSCHYSFSNPHGAGFCLPEWLAVPDSVCCCVRSRTIHGAVGPVEAPHAGRTWAAANSDRIGSVAVSRDTQIRQ